MAIAISYGLVATGPMKGIKWAGKLKKLLSSNCINYDDLKMCQFEDLKIALASCI
jgi:hypothetical protein